jgi:hypothetical protein
MYSRNIMFGGINMFKGYQVMNSNQEIEKENNILYQLIQELSVAEVKKITGKKCEAWYEKETSGSLTGYELIFDNGNRVFIDTKLSGKYVLLHKLFIKEKKTGLGSRILTFYKHFIDSNGGVFMVCEVINLDFFNKFPWLSFDEYQNYYYRFGLNG